MTTEQIGTLLGAAVIVIINALQMLGNGKRIKKVQNEFEKNGGASLRDVVDRIEEKIDIHRQKVYALFSDSSTLLFECDKYGECVWVNKKYLEVVKRGLEDIVGAGWIMCVNPKDRKKVYDNWDESVKYERPSEICYSLVDVDGVEYPVIARTFVIKDSKDKLHGFVGSIRLLSTS